jgi:hypothetical protein
MSTNGIWIQVDHEQKITNSMVFKLGQSNFQFECEVHKVRVDEDKE